MIPQQKCVSLETAKRLREAWFPQDTERWWSWYNQETNKLWEITKGRQYESWYAAPDAQEMGLPESINVYGEHGHLHIGYGTREVGKWTVGYANYEARCSEIFDHANEAEARAACWLWLKEQKLL